MKALFVPMLLLATVMQATAQIPDRPELLVFEELSYTLPDAAAFRSRLGNGIAVYAMRDPVIPLVRIELLFRGGTYLEPREKAGLASIAGDAWRFGGAGERSAIAFDERLDALAAEIEVHIGDVAGQVSLDVLSPNLEPAMALLMDLLVRPCFQEDRFEAARAELVHRMRARNDDPADIEQRTWRRLVYGEEFWLNRLPTRSSVDDIGVADCRRFIGSLVGSGNMVVAASGDFDPDALDNLLQGTIGRLPPIDRPVPAVPQPARQEAAGVFAIDVPNAPQCFVRLGHMGYRIGHTDEAPLTVFNRIFGGGDFTSRLVRQIRSEHGLAYEAWSEMIFGLTTPGHFAACFRSRSETCSEAAAIAVGVLESIRSDGVTSDEVQTAVRAIVHGFPNRFDTAARIVGRFAADELIDRPVDYWARYRDQIASVTTGKVKQSAVEHIDPDRLIVLVIGDIGAVLKSRTTKGPSFEALGQLQRLPLPDPLTLEPPDE